MFQFNARTVAPAQGFEPWADGWYPVIIKRTNIKPTKDNDGGYLQLDLECIGGPNQGKVNFIRLNLFNKNQQAVEIAHRQLSAICHVIGVYDVNANAVEDQAAPMLHNLPFNARCTTNKNVETGQSGNNFVAFKDMNGNDPGKQGQQPAAPQPQGGYAPQGQPGGQQWGGPAPQQPGPQSQPFTPGQPQAQPWTGGVGTPQPQWGGQQGPGPGQAPQQPPQGQPPQQPQWGAPQGQPQQPAAPQPQGGGQAPQWAGQPSQPGPQPQQQPQWSQNAGGPPPNAPWGPR